MKKFKKLLQNKLEEVRYMEFIDLIIDKSSVEDYISENIEAHQDDMEEIEYLIGYFIKWFVYKKEIYERTGE